jgi:site-specific DNA-cytosine methylase
MIHFFKTIRALRPRVWCLEYVKRLICKKFLPEFKLLLEKMSGYHFVFKVLRSVDWGIPQVRERLYVVGIRKDCKRGRWLALRNKFDDVLESSKVAGSCPNFLDFLAQHFCPIEPPARVPMERTAVCCCGTSFICQTHPCRCPACSRHGEAARLCKWRKRSTHYVLANKGNRRTYLAAWRKVRQDPKLKAAPSYFEMARAKKLAGAQAISSPRERVLLQTVSGSENLMHPSVIVDLSQSIHRLVRRRDGKVPTIGTGSTKLYLPFSGKFLNHRHCLALNGMRSKIFEEHGLTTI